jgi:hypothetical protein
MKLGIVKFILLLLFVFLILIMNARSNNFKLVVDKKNEDSFFVKGENIDLYVNMQGNGIGIFAIKDDRGRNVNISFTNLGILHYEIRDDHGYVVESSFTGNWPLEYGIEAGPGNEALTVDDDPNGIIRREIYRGFEQKYKVNYEFPPYFSLIEIKED